MKTQRQQKINDILDAAGSLFTQQGYDQTSIKDILETLGIAKGTLYHYFESKEAILDALIDRMNQDMKKRAHAISIETDKPVLERMIETILSLNINEHEFSKEVLEIIHRPQNALMHQKIEETILLNITPIMTSLVKEGITEGLFNTKFPFEASEMLLSYSLIFFSESEEVQMRMYGFIYNMERLLGVKEGELAAFFSVFNEGQ